VCNADAKRRDSRTIAELQALDCTGCVAWRTDAAFNLCLATKELLDYCSKNGIVLQAFAALGHSSEPKLLDDPVITAIAKRVNETPAQVLLAWAIQRGTALLTTSKTPGRIKENFEVSTLPQDAMLEISEGIKSRVRFNAVVETGVPGFIPRGKGV
jgi:diketogulonate reductase-like aldo/keto reductase